MGETSVDRREFETGERALQERFSSQERAAKFYERSMHEHLTDRMQAFIEERIMFFLSTADAKGRTDCSPRVGPPGFVTVRDDQHIRYPEYRGNGVHASLGNLTENPHATFLFVDWWNTTVGLHVNGRATLHEGESESENTTGSAAESDKTKVWVDLEVEEAYIHCAKHLPRLSIEEFDPPWGTDDAEAKRTGFFEAE